MKKQQLRRCVAFSAGLLLCAGPLCANSLAVVPLDLPGFRAKTTEPPVQPSIFPSVSAEGLDKTLVNIPSQLEGRLNLLLLSWARNQAQQVDSWTAVSQALIHTHFDVRVYRMPISSPENALYRWWDNASLRAAETDPDLLHWSVPIYIDKGRLHRALQTEGDEGHVVAVLVDRTGKIVWKAQGDSTAAARASLLQAASLSH